MTGFDWHAGRGSLSELVQMQLAVIPPSVRTLRPDTPLVLDALVTQMLAKQQDARPGSVWEVAQRYDTALGELGEAATLNWATQAPTLLQDALRATVQPALQPAPYRTELMSNAPTPRRFEVNAAPSGSAPLAEAHGLPKRRSMLLPGVLLGATLVGSGLAIFRYGFDAGADSRKQREMALLATSPMPSPTPTPTAAPKPAKTKPVVKAPTPTPLPERQFGPPDERRGPPPDGRFGPPDGRRLPPPPGEFRGFRRGEDLPAADQAKIRQQISQMQLTQARQQYEQGKYRNALRTCESALRLDPKNTEAAALQKKIQDAMKILNDK